MNAFPATTALSHRPLAAIEPLPFDDEVLLTDYNGYTFVCSFDVLRHMYNAVVENMLACQKYLEERSLHQNEA